MMPKYEAPMVVMEVLSEPIQNTKEFGTAEAAELLDVKVGILRSCDNNEIDFVLYHLNSKRLELFKQ